MLAEINFDYKHEDYSAIIEYEADINECGIIDNLLEYYVTSITKDSYENIEYNCINDPRQMIDLYQYLLFSKAMVIIKLDEVRESNQE